MERVLGGSERLDSRLRIVASCRFDSTRNEFRFVSNRTIKKGPSSFLMKHLPRMDNYNLNTKHVNVLLGYLAMLRKQIR